MSSGHLQPGPALVVSEMMLSVVNSITACLVILYQSYRKVWHEKYTELENEIWSNSDKRTSFPFPLCHNSFIFREGKVNTYNF